MWVSERDAGASSLPSQQKNHNKARQARIRRAVPMAAVTVQPTICGVSMAGCPGPARPTSGMAQGAGAKRGGQKHPWGLPCWSAPPAQGDLCIFPLFYKLKTAEYPCVFFLRSKQQWATLCLLSQVLPHFFTMGCTRLAENALYPV